MKHACIMDESQIYIYTFKSSACHWNYNDTQKVKKHNFRSKNLHIAALSSSSLSLNIALIPITLFMKLYKQKESKILCYVFKTVDLKVTNCKSFQMQGCFGMYMSIF